MHLTVSPKLIVYNKNEFFQIIFFELRSIEILNLSKTLLFEFLNFSKTLLVCSFIIFKRTQGTSTPNFICFIKKNEWIVCAIARPFRDKEMLTWKIKQKLSKLYYLGPYNARKQVCKNYDVIFIMMLNSK